MAFFDSTVSWFLIDDAKGSRRDLSPYLTEVSGLPGPRALNEVTALGDGGARFVPGLERVTIRLEGIFDNTASTGPDQVLGALRTHASPVDFEYGPEGAATGDVGYAGSCWVASYVLRSRVGRLVEWSASLQVDGAVRRETF